MRAIAQFTIHSLNDVVTSATAPTNPYLGQLWVNTSYSPPRTYVWNGSAWKEQNGTDSIRNNVSTLTTKTSQLETNLNGLTSTVTVLTQQVDNNTGEITTISSKVSTLEQTAESIEGRVSDNEDRETVRIECGDIRRDNRNGWYDRRFHHRCNELDELERRFVYRDYKRKL